MFSIIIILMIVLSKLAIVLSLSFLCKKERNRIYISNHIHNCITCRRFHQEIEANKIINDFYANETCIIG
jgi:hypothetical protein